VFGLTGKRYRGPERRSYDAFVSYRRDTGSEVARLVRLALIAHGYRVFLDVDDLPGGPFDDRLLVSIENSRGFVAVLAPGTLDRIGAPGDWLRKEIRHALHRQRNIVPLMMPEFSYPDPVELPTEIRSLARLNAIPYSHEYFEAMVFRLAERLGPPADASSSRPAPRRPADDEQTRLDKVELRERGEQELLALRLYEEAEEWLAGQIESRTQVLARLEGDRAMADAERRKAARLDAERKATARMLDEIRQQLEDEEKTLSRVLDGSDATMPKDAYEAAVAARGHVKCALQNAGEHITRLGVAARRTGPDPRHESEGEEAMAKIALNHCKAGLSRLASQIGA